MILGYLALIAQIALGVIIGGLTIALVVIGFFVWNSRQRNERLAVHLFFFFEEFIGSWVMLGSLQLRTVPSVRSKPSDRFHDRHDARLGHDPTEQRVVASLLDSLFGP